MGEIKEEETWRQCRRGRQWRHAAPRAQRPWWRNYPARFIWQRRSAQGKLIDGQQLHICGGAPAGSAALKSGKSQIYNCSLYIYVNPPQACTRFGMELMNQMRMCRSSQMKLPPFFCFCFFCFKSSCPFGAAALNSCVLFKPASVWHSQSSACIQWLMSDKLVDCHLLILLLFYSEVTAAAVKMQDIGKQS